MNLLGRMRWLYDHQSENMRDQSSAHASDEQDTAEDQVDGSSPNRGAMHKNKRSKHQRKMRRQSSSMPSNKGSKSLESSRAQLKSVRAKRKNTRSIIKSLKMKNEGLAASNQLQLESACRKMERLSAENTALHASMKTYEIQNLQCNEENEGLKLKVEGLTEDLREVSHHNKSLEDELKQSTSRYDELLESFKELRQINKHNEALNQTLSMRVDDIHRTCFLPYLNAKGERADPEIIQDYSEEIIKALLKDALEPRVSHVKAQESEEKIRALQHQLLENLEDKSVDLVCDKVFEESFSELAELIRDLIRSMKLPDAATILSNRIIKNSCLVRTVRRGFWSKREKSMMEAYIWSMLCDLVFRSPFTVLSRESKSIDETYLHLFGKKHNHAWPVPSEASEKWRQCVTQHMLSPMNRSKPKDGTMARQIGTLTAWTERYREYIINSISPPLLRIDRKANLSALKPIVEQACTLALKMSLQSFRVQVVFPKIGENYNRNRSPGLSPMPESDHIREGRVNCVVNPGLAKWGDAHGKKLDQRLDIVPSLVFIQAI